MHRVAVQYVLLGMNAQLQQKLFLVHWDISLWAIKQFALRVLPDITVQIQALFHCHVWSALIPWEIRYTNVEFATPNSSIDKLHFMPSRI